jgi:integrase
MFKRSDDTSLPAAPGELTDVHLKNLKPRDKAYDRLVGEGLILRVLPSGSISFRYNYRLDGKQRVATVGVYPKKSLKVLRAQYDLMAEKVDKGEDVAAARAKKKAVKRTNAQEARAERARKRNVLTIEALADLFLKYLESPKATNKHGRPYSAKTLKEYRQHLLRHYIPQFGALPVEEVRRKDVARWLEKVADKTPTQANRIMATLGVMYSWAIGKDLVESSPVVKMNKPAPSVKKDRALDYDPDLQKVIDNGEIRTFWTGFDDINPLHRMALRLILMTALRPGEVLSASWKNIFEDEWIIPISQTKSKSSAHKVPLTGDLKKMLKELRGLSGSTPYLFPQSRYADGKLEVLRSARSGKYESVQTNTVSRILKKQTVLKPYTAHDLRRTAATHIKDLGYLDAEIGMLLHHSTADVTAIYARGDDGKRKLRMLNAWHRQLKTILTGEKSGKVVNFK